MASRGSSGSRLLLVILLVTSLFFITLDLRGVNVLASLRNQTQSILPPIQAAAGDFFNPITTLFSDIGNLGRTRNEIATLKKENQELRSGLVLNKEIMGELNQLKGVIDLAAKGQFKVVAARVIGRGSSALFDQTITLDVGSSDGITRDMSVISALGLVGVVKSLTSHSAIVLLMSDPSFRMGVRVASTQDMGILSGEGGTLYSLQLLSATSDIKVGDDLLARGSENNQPFVPGVPVGKVTAVEIGAGQLTKSARVRGFVNLHALGVVSVVISASGRDPRDGLLPAKPAPAPTVTIFVTPTPKPSP